MIKNLKDLFSEIFYDWGFSHTERQINRDQDDFWINKTYIYKRDDSYFLSYKTSTTEIKKEVFLKFTDFFNIYEKDEKMEYICNIIEDHWFNKNKSLIIEKDYISLNSSLSFSFENNRIIMREKQKEKINEEELDTKFKDSIIAFFNFFK